MIGKTIDNVTVIDKVGKNKNGYLIYRCKCSCGSEVEMSSLRLRDSRRKNSLNCGCRLNLNNRKFGRLLVVQETTRRAHGEKYWLCKCNCGNLLEVVGSSLKSGNTTSCGCYRNEVSISNLQTDGYTAATRTRKFPPHLSSARVVWRRYKDGDLTFDDFCELSQSSCQYCGELPQNSNSYKINTKRLSSFAKENGMFCYNGLDRIDSSIGHIKSNVVPCCKICNYAKRDLTIDEFRNWINKVFNNYIKKDKL